MLKKYQVPSFSSDSKNTVDGLRTGKQTGTTNTTKSNPLGLNLD